MDQILLCLNDIPPTTAIPSSFIRNYMPEANGSYVKVYLYLAMCLLTGEEELSISFLADRLENTEKDILRALHYWEKHGLLALQTDASREHITGIRMLNPDASPADAAKTADIDGAPSPDSHTAAASQKPTETKPFSDTSDGKSTPYETASAKEISVTEEQTLRVTQNDDFSWICLIVENYLKRTLNTAEVQLLTYLFDTLHFSKELILYLYEYCCSLEKTNVKYVQTVALSWAELGITTQEEAKLQSTIYSASHTAIAKALALGRPLAKIECQYIERWQNVWHMDLAVILEACNRTMLSIQKPDFKYLDGILGNWHRDNVHTLQDVQLCDAKHKQKKDASAPQTTQKQSSGNRTNTGTRSQFQAFQQRNTSQEEIDQLEKILLTR